MHDLDAARLSRLLLLSSVVLGAAPAQAATLFDPSFIFLGDDTGSAGAHVLIGNIAVAAVPLPPALARMPLALLVRARRRG